MKDRNQSFSCNSGANRRGIAEQIYIGDLYFAGQIGGQKSQQLRAGASLAVLAGWFTA